MRCDLCVLNFCTCRFDCDAVVCWFCGFYTIYTHVCLSVNVFGFIVPRYEKLVYNELILSIDDGENVFIWKCDKFAGF